MKTTKFEITRMIYLAIWLLKPFYSKCASLNVIDIVVIHDPIKSLFICVCLSAKIKVYKSIEKQILHISF